LHGGAIARLPSERARSERLAMLALGALSLVLVAIGPMVVDEYSVNILVRSFLYGCIAVTVDILWGFTGILTFGQAAFFGIGAYALGLAVTTYDFSTPVVIAAFVAGPLVAAAVAVIVAWLAFGPKVSPLYISVVTLVQSVIFVQVIYSGGNFTGSSSGLSGFDTFDVPMEGWFRITGVALVIVTALGWLFVRSDFGRLLIAIRENEQRCRYCGIGTARVKTMLLAASAMVAAMAGYAYAAYNDVIAPDLGNFEFGTELVIWVALGGRGTLLGPAIAAVLIDFISAYLSGTLPFIWQLIVGLVFIVVIVPWAPCSAEPCRSAAARFRRCRRWCRCRTGMSAATARRRRSLSRGWRVAMAACMCWRTSPSPPARGNWSAWWGRTGRARRR
jgi:branched-chain amino acid transport system permease protein